MARDGQVRRAARWMAVSGLVWTLLWLLDVGSVLLAGVFWPDFMGPIPLGQASLLRAVPWTCWWLLTPAVFVLADRFRFDAGQRASSLVVHVAASVATMLAIDVVKVVVLTSMQLQTPRFVVSVPGLVLYAAVAGTATLLGLRRRERQLAAEIAAAKVQAVAGQLTPHFLYNALNGIAMLIRADERQAALKAVLGYAELLRTTVHSSAADVLLSQELASIDRYLAIERLRFPDTLTTALISTPDAERALVPSLILQPIVENALHHGLGEMDADAHLEVVASRHGEALRLEVRDNGAGLPPGWHIDRGSRVGLGNTRSRLHQRYGERGRIDVHSRAEGGTVAVIELPFETAPR